MDASAKVPVDSTPSPSAGALNVVSLTQGMESGDESAYRDFHAAYFDRLFRYLLVVAAGDEDAARDALQGTFSRVVRHVRVFTDEAVFWSWLTVLARSSYADDRKKHRRYLAFLDRFSRHADITGSVVTPDNSDDRLREALAGGLALLPEEERRLLDWKYTDRTSVREIADRLATSEKAVESRLTRTRLKLRELILRALKT